MSLAEVLDLPNGARFYRADLHIHSVGASYDVRDAGLTPEAIVDAAVAEGLGVIAITDHDEIASVERALAAAEGKPLLVVPGIELSTPQGHLLAYLPEYDALRKFLWSSAHWSRPGFGSDDLPQFYDRLPRAPQGARWIWHPGACRWTEGIRG